MPKSGILSEAIDSYKQALGISGRHNWALTSLLVLYKEPSEFQLETEADFIYREMLAKEKMGYVSPFLLAISSAAIGKKEEAIRYTRLALERHDPAFANYSPSRTDSKAIFNIPEFRKMMKDTGLYY